MRQRGFTLLELLTAMAVLAVLGVLSFRGLDSILDADARLQAETRRWRDVSLLLSQLGEDATMAVGRTSRAGDDRTRPALRIAGGDQSAADGEEAQLVLSRLGIGEGAAAQSAPRRVGYRLRENKLEYLVWASPDGAPGAEPAVYLLLEGVSGLQWQALHPDGRWVDAWPVGREADTLPRAISVRLALAGGLEVTRVLALR